MEEKKTSNKEIFRKKRNKYYLRGEEREWNNFFFFFFQIVATVRAFPLRMLKGVYAKFQYQNIKKVTPSKLSNCKSFGILLQ